MIGETVKFKKTLSSGKRVFYTGIVYGRVKDRGGWKWLLREIKVEGELTAKKVSRV